MTFGLLKVSKTQKVVKGSKLVKIAKKRSFQPCNGFYMAFTWLYLAFNGFKTCKRLPKDVSN